MSGTSLVILAMYSTTNVVGSAGHHLYKHYGLMLGMLLVAGGLTMLAIYLEAQPPRRQVRRPAAVPPLARRNAGPRPRRA